MKDTALVMCCFTCVYLIMSTYMYVCCITWEVEGIRQRGRQKKTWWDCVKNVMESLGLSQKDVQSRNKWRRRIKGATG